jgi:hypothetical protein
MGIGDFFKGRRKKKEDPAMKGQNETPRCDHYIFSHAALRQFAFSSPYMCMGALGTADGQKFLKDLLAAVAIYCHEQGEAMTLTLEQIRVHSFRVKKNPCLVFEMPEPRAATEVFFVGIVLKPSAGETAADLTKAELRYFTLEKSFDKKNPTMLGEWTEDNDHINHGSGPAPVVKKFVDKITELFVNS